MAVNSWMITRLFWPDDTVAVNSWMILLWLLQLDDTVAVVDDAVAVDDTTVAVTVG